jgi:hypothetical protein
MGGMFNVGDCEALYKGLVTAEVVIPELKGTPLFSVSWLSDNIVRRFTIPTNIPPKTFKYRE